jgi:hypothetical protein
MLHRTPPVVLEALGRLRAHGLRQVAVHARVCQVNCGAGIVAQHPRKHRVLRQVLEGTPGLTKTHACPHEKHACKCNVCGGDNEGAAAEREKKRTEAIPGARRESDCKVSLCTASLLRLSLLPPSPSLPLALLRYVCACTCACACACALGQAGLAYTHRCAAPRCPTLPAGSGTSGSRTSRLGPSPTDAP